MDPLITNRIDPALLRVPEKRGQERSLERDHERDSRLRRKRPVLPENSEEGLEHEPDLETPRHTLDDLA